LTPIQNPPKLPISSNLAYGKRLSNGDSRMKQASKISISTSILLLALTSTAVAKEAEATAPLAKPGKVYLGILGGVGSTNSFNANQYGTVFLTEAAGGPLAVNAFGSASSQSAGLLGLQVGYQYQDRLINPGSQWSFAPAFELEGLMFADKTFNGELINNTVRLPERDFIVTYPLKRNVFLINTVFNFSHPGCALRPYVGFGIGGGVVRISGASSNQIQPIEVGVNHYNANASDTDAAFAGQIKAGLGYDVNQYVNVFIEYRWLYLSNTHFTLGSTIVPGHAETSSWQVDLGPQRTNIGTVGVRFNI
jgi:hypothetical protein